MKASLALFFGFAFFGMLIGLITGITSAAVTSSIMTALFAFMGGKVFLKVDSKSKEVQLNMGLILAGFGLFCALGLLGGVFIKANHLLTMHYSEGGKGQSKDKTPDSSADLPYVRGENYQAFKDSVRQLYGNGKITAEKALTLILDKK